MELDGVMHALGMMTQVFLLDLLLSGDNAVVIALACRSLPPQQRRKVILIGTGVAIALRVLLTTVISFLLTLPSLRLIGGVVLLYIAVKLMLPSDADDAADEHAAAAPTALWSALGVVVVADVVMSLDNVVALAAAVHGSMVLLLFGLLLSVPLLMYGSLFVVAWLKRYPWLVPTVGALLGWIAGDISISDPLLVDWVNSQSPALKLAVPLLCAVFVLRYSTILQAARLAAPARPQALAANPSALPGLVSDWAGQWRKWRMTLASTKRSTQLLAATLVMALALLLYFGKSLLPVPAQLLRYDCPGFSGTFALYYKAGEPQVQVRSGRDVLDGAWHAGRIDWGDAAGATLGFLPPDQIAAGDLKSIRINGGHFVQIVCAQR